MRRVELNKAMILAMMSAARESRDNAYAPYSNFKVGAAVMGDSGKIYLGSNVENASFGLCMCAERIAIYKAVNEGERRIKAVVVVAGESEIARPCGACLQVISEFSLAEDPTVIVAANADLSYDVGTLDDYLPMRFNLEQ